jgi:hypothetical protein
MTNSLRPLRPREPGQPPPINDGPGLPRSLVIAAAVAGIVVAGGLGVKIVNVLRDPEPADLGELAATAEATVDGDSGQQLALALPLDLADVGFDSGTVEETATDEGPGAISYCDHPPEATGLIEWRGNRLTENRGQRRVAQIVANFTSARQAAAYLASNSSIVDCTGWSAGSDGGAKRFTVIEETPQTVFGDETKQFEVEVDNDGPALFLRTLLIRSGAKIAQLTFVSVNRQDLSAIETLAAEATVELGF